MAGRRTSLASLAGAKVDDVPGRSDPVLLTLPLDKLHCTRFNPRRNFGTEEELRDFGEKLKKEQLQPAVVVSRAAYLKLWPEEAERVGAASYVIANGERRYRASKLVGRPVLEVVHREDVAKDRAAFLDAVQSENNDRKNLDPIERAIAIETMVTELGGAEQVATYYGKTKGWVSQQRKLLKLTPELQDVVSAGDMPVRLARDIAGLPQEVQAKAWEEELERRRLEKEAGARLRAQAANPPAPEPSPTPLPQGPRFTAVNQAPPSEQTAPAPQPTREVRFTAVNRQADTEAEPETNPQADTALHTDADPNQASIPDPRPESEHRAEPAEGQPPRFPYEDGAFAARHLIRKMPPEELDRLYDVLTEHRTTHAATAG